MHTIYGMMPLRVLGRQCKKYGGGGLKFADNTDVCRRFQLIAIRYTVMLYEEMIAIYL